MPQDCRVSASDFVFLNESRECVVVWVSLSFVDGD